MTHSLDFITLAIYFLLQWHVTVRWRKLARVRSGRARQFAYGAIVLADIILLTGWLVTFLPVAGGPYWKGTLAEMLRTLVLCYFPLAVGVLAVRRVAHLLKRAVDPGEVNPGRRRLITLAGHAAIAAPFAAISYGALFERLDFRVKEVDIPMPGLHPDLDGLRILHLSDIHLSAFLSEAQFARVIDSCNELRPHIAAVTGDLISWHGDPVETCIKQLMRLQTDAGVVACMGNHELFVNIEDYTQKVGSAAGIPFLRMRSMPLRFGQATLNFAGVDHQPSNKKSDYLRGAERLIVPGETNILLSHNPDVFPVAARQGYDLMLAGHTHGGQVSVEILDQAISPARFLTPFVYGLYRQGNATAYVTRGIGTVGIPARIGAPPEISLLRLRKV